MMEVKVLDRPAAPDPPLKTSVEGSACNLLWKKVKDDGGAPVEYYQVWAASISWSHPTKLNSFRFLLFSD